MKIWKAVTRYKLDDSVRQHVIKTTSSSPLTLLVTRAKWS